MGVESVVESEELLNGALVSAAVEWLCFWLFVARSSNPATPSWKVRGDGPGGLFMLATPVTWAPKTFLFDFFAALLAPVEAPC